MYQLIAAVSIAFFGFILWIIDLANTGQNSIFFELVAAMFAGAASLLSVVPRSN